MSNLDSKRDAIIAELKKRVDGARWQNKVPWIFEGDGGIDNVEQFPSVFLYELEEVVTSSDVYRKGLYQKTLPIQIEYFIKITDRKKIPAEGRKIIKLLSSALELDDRFSDLTIQYYMTGNTIVEMRDGVVDVVVLYEFVYVDKFMGYGPNRL